MARGTKLDSSGEDPAFFTHADCWFTEGSENEELWEWESAEMRALCLDLIKELEELTDENLESLRVDLECDVYESDGPFFDELTEICLRNGFDVYDSGTMFEAYYPEEE